MNASIVNIADAGGYFTATEVEAALQELALNSRGVAVADVTLDGAWQDGATVDAGANTITVASATGLANGTPIEFRANTGVLPAGITAYTNGAKGIGDGDYFNIINLSGTTFQITATVGGTTPVDITSAGTAGWQWRVAGAASFGVTGLSLDTHSEYDVYLLLWIAKKSTLGSNFYASLGPSLTITWISYASGSSAWGNTSAFMATPLITDRYGVTVCKMNLRKMGSGLVLVSWSGSGADSAARTTSTLRLFTASGVIGQYTPKDISTLNINDNSGAGVIRNGSRLIVVRRGA